VKVLEHEADAYGRESGTIGRLFVAGFAAGWERPWASAGAWQELVERFVELGFDEFVFPEPDPEDWSVFELVTRTVIPDLRQSRTASRQSAARSNVGVGSANAE
jgi:hypothetical protein